MSLIKMLVAICTLATLQAAQAHDHNHPADHVRHNMVIYGSEEIFVSHIVYKVPHNFQVILKLELDAATKELYLRERRANPNDQFIYLLNEMKIANIGEQTEISGTLFRRDANGQKTTLIENLTLDRRAFTIIFFNELPLSLAPN